jgi:GNAT superfamily N-acetyltransferase
MRIREAVAGDIPAIGAIHVEAWRANYRGMIPDDAIDSRTVELRKATWHQVLGQPRRVTLVACDDGGAVTGFASAFRLPELHNGFDSFLQMLFIAEPLKGRGIGRALLSAIAQKMCAAGARSMALRTLRLNPARAFYERVGAELVPDGIDVDRGEFDDVVYGFRDLSTLTA